MKSTKLPDFGQVYKENVESVYRYVYARVGNRSDAEDITSQTFFEALEKWPSYRDEGRTGAWLFAIARHHVADFYRRRKPTVPLEKVDPAQDDPPAPLEEIEREDEREKIRKLIMELPDREQELLRLRFAAGLKYREMAELLGRSEASVKMAVHRIVKRLAQVWRDRYGDD